MKCTMSLAVRIPRKTMREHDIERDTRTIECDMQNTIHYTAPYTLGNNS